MLAHEGRTCCTAPFDLAVAVSFHAGSFAAVCNGVGAARMAAGGKCKGATEQKKDSDELAHRASQGEFWEPRGERDYSAGWNSNQPEDQPTSSQQSNSDFPRNRKTLFSSISTYSTDFHTLM